MEIGGKKACPNCMKQNPHGKLTATFKDVKTKELITQEVEDENELRKLEGKKPLPAKSTLIIPNQPQQPQPMPVVSIDDATQALYNAVDRLPFGNIQEAKRILKIKRKIAELQLEIKALLS